MPIAARTAVRQPAKMSSAMRNALAALAVVLAFLLGAGVVWQFAQRAPALPDGPALILKVREVARLETLDVQLYKKVTFEPEPADLGLSWAAVSQWASYQVRTPRGKAFVFAEAHLGLDLRKLDEKSLRVVGRRVEVVLPPLEVKVELKPGETEIIGSNLDSQQTAQLFEMARGAFERQVESDLALKERARESARQSLRSLFVGLGFSEVVFPAALPPGRKTG